MCGEGFSINVATQSAIMKNGGEMPENSPIEYLHKYLISSLERIAPEKARQLQHLLDHHRITFIIDDQHLKRVAFADHADNTITIGVRALERLWARGFAYISLYEFLTRRLLVDPTATDHDLTHPDVKPGMDLLAWVVDVEHRLDEDGPGDISWPRDLKRPSQAAGKDTLENAADEIFLCAVASILHHEVGHIRQGHDPRNLPRATPGLDPEEDPNVQEANAIRIGWEKEADAWSANWMLDDVDQHDDRFLKRILGTALGYLWLATRNIHTGKWRHPKYPPAWDRIYHTVKQHISGDPTHPIWLFLAYALQLHLMSVGQHQQVGPCENPEEWVNKLLDHLSKSAA